MRTVLCKVDQRVKDGFSSSRKCSITWPANVEIAEFKDGGDCRGIMFPSDFFWVNKIVIKWTNQSLPHDIPPFTPHEFLQCIGEFVVWTLLGWSKQCNKFLASNFVSRFVAGTIWFVSGSFLVLFKALASRNKQTLLGCKACVCM